MMFSDNTSRLFHDKCSQVAPAARAWSVHTGSDVDICTCHCCDTLWEQSTINIGGVRPKLSCWTIKFILYTVDTGWESRQPPKLSYISRHTSQGNRRQAPCSLHNGVQVEAWSQKLTHCLLNVVSRGADWIQIPPELFFAVINGVWTSRSFVLRRADTCTIYMLFSSIFIRSRQLVITQTRCHTRPPHHHPIPTPKRECDLHQGRLGNQRKSLLFPSHQQMSGHRGHYFLFLYPRVHLPLLASLGCRVVVGRELRGVDKVLVLEFSVLPRANNYPTITSTALREPCPCCSLRFRARSISKLYERNILRLRCVTTVLSCPRKNCFIFWSNVVPILLATTESVHRRNTAASYCKHVSRLAAPSKKYLMKT